MSHQIGSFEIEKDGKIDRFDDRYSLRLWLFTDFEDLLRRSGRFEIAAIYGEDFEELRHGERLSGELGNVYVILRKTCATLSAFPSDR